MAMTACGMNGDMSSSASASPPVAPRLAMTVPSTETTLRFGGRSGIDQELALGMRAP
jgi:hypothetical protein